MIAHFELIHARLVHERARAITLPDVPKSRRAKDKKDSEFKISTAKIMPALARETVVHHKIVKQEIRFNVSQEGQ